MFLALPLSYDDSPRTVMFWLLMVRQGLQRSSRGRMDLQNLRKALAAIENGRLDDVTLRQVHAVNTHIGRSKEQPGVAKSQSPRRRTQQVR